MKKLFNDQLEQNKPLTEEVISQLKKKTYFNSEDFRVGDVILYAMLIGEVIEKEDETPELPIELITLNERHFDSFKSDKRDIISQRSSNLPIIRLR